MIMECTVVLVKYSFVNVYIFSLIHIVDGLFTGLFCPPLIIQTRHGQSIFLLLSLQHPHGRHMVVNKLHGLHQPINKLGPDTVQQEVSTLCVVFDCCPAFCQTYLSLLTQKVLVPTNCILTADGEVIKRS